MSHGRQARIIQSLVSAASSRFAACETEADFAAQQRLYGELLDERIDELLAAYGDMRERAAIAMCANYAAGSGRADPAVQAVRDRLAAEIALLAGA